MDISKIIEKPESKTLEFKRDLSSTKPILKTIVAFANTAGGMLIIGKESEGELVGITNILDAEEKISNLIADHIRPAILPEIEVVTVNGKDLVVIRVSRWRGPFYLKQEGPEKGVYIRLGSTSRRAQGNLLNELQRDLGNIIYDQQPLPEVGEKSLDQTYLKSCFKKVGRRITHSNMKTLKILVPYQNRVVASVGGVILFGKDQVRQQNFPNARISCARFQGPTKTQFVDRYEIEGSILNAITDVPKFIKKNTRLATIIKGMKRIDVQEYPETAIREVLINALVHADYSIIERHIQVAIYSDRLEFINPGAFPLGYTLKDFKTGISHIRNHTIVRVFKELGEMEEWGSGYRRIVSTCQEEGYPIPVWEEISNSLRVTFFPHPSTSLEKTPSIPIVSEYISIENRLLQLFERKSDWKISELLNELGGEIKVRSLRYELTKLKSRGILDTKGKGPVTYWHKVS